MDEREGKGEGDGGGGGTEHGGGEVERARDGVRLIVLAMLGKKKMALVHAVCEVIVGSGSAKESGGGEGGAGAGASLRETARRHGVHEQTLASAVRAARRRIREVIGDGRGEGEGEGVKGGGA